MTSKEALVAVLFVLPVIRGCGDVSYSDDASDYSEFTVSRFKRQTVSDRKACGPGNPEQPATRVDSTRKLTALRQEMDKLDLDAFLIPSGDSHQSEKTGPADSRRQWLSGFSGSAGFAVITSDKAAQWTDGR